MSEFVVHSIPGSPFGRAVLMTLEEKGAPCRLAVVNPGAMKVQPHLSRHPFGRVPVLEHGSLMLYETAAILRYLDRVLPTPPLTPSDPAKAALMDQLMNVSDWYLFRGVNDVIGFQRIVGPRLMGLTPDEGAIAAAMPAAHTVIAEIARSLEDGSPYLAGETVTLADILVLGHMDFLSQTPEWEALAGDRPKLVGWLDRMNARPAARATTWERVAELATAG